MITLRRDQDRHHAQRRHHDVWLTFYPQRADDPLASGFHALEMLTENRLPPGAGVSPQPRRQAETVTYVLQGALAQQDSGGHSNVVSAGEFQRRSTPSGVHHSEHNASATDWAHIFRISLSAAAGSPAADQEQKRFPVAEHRGVLCAVASPDGRAGSLRVQQDLIIFSAILDAGQQLTHELTAGRCAWLHVVRGEVVCGDVALTGGDGAGITAERAIALTARSETEILLLDLPEAWPGLVQTGGAA
jgi:hypothetical protein